MKYLLTVLFALLLSGTLIAQSNPGSLHDSLVARFNRDDYKAFYELGSFEWKRENTLDGIIGWLNYMKEQTGPIKSAILAQDSGAIKYFVWDGQKKMIGFKLNSSGGKVFQAFDFKTYHVPASALNGTKILNDNPLKTVIDSCVNSITTDFMITHKLIGLSIGIVKDGRRFNYNYGTVQKGKSELPTSHTTFELSSITKTFTGILLAQAVLDKKLSLSDDIRKYIGMDYSNLQFKGKPIRIVDLSNHTSGLPAILPDLEQYKSSFDVLKMYDHYTDDKFLQDLRLVKIDTLPGKVYQYSNTGVKLLGIILEKAYGLKYRDLLKKYISGPMKMSSTKTAPDVSDTTSYTKGYNGLGELMPHLNFNMLGGAGSVLSTSNDMMNYLQENISERIPSVKLSHQPTFADGNFSIGMGWQVAHKTINGTRIWKSGGALGFRSYCAVVPAKYIGIIWLSNRSDLQEDELTEMIDQLLYHILMSGKRG